jgi:hypothetical protein
MYNYSSASHLSGYISNPADHFAFQSKWNIAMSHKYLPYSLALMKFYLSSIFSHYHQQFRTNISTKKGKKKGKNKREPWLQ